MDIALTKINTFSFIRNLKKHIINLLLFNEAMLNYELRKWGCLEASTSLMASPWYPLLPQHSSLLSQHWSFCNLSLYFFASAPVICSHVYLPSPPLEGKLHGGRDFDWRFPLLHSQPLTVMQTRAGGQAASLEKRPRERSRSRSSLPIAFWISTQLQQV